MLKVTIELVPPGASHKKTTLGTLEIASASEIDEEAFASASDFYAVAVGEAADGRRQGVVRTSGKRTSKWGAFRLCVEAIKALRLDLIER